MYVSCGKMESCSIFILYLEKGQDNKNVQHNLISDYLVATYQYRICRYVLKKILKQKITLKTVKRMYGFPSYLLYFIL